MAEKKNRKKATLDMLMAKATKAADESIQYKDYYCEPLDAVLSIKKVGVRKIAQLLDGMKNDDSILENLETNIEIVYEAVPLFHNEELQKAAGCVEPYDIVLKVLDDNIGEIQEMAKFIMGMYGMAVDETVENLKN